MAEDESNCEEQDTKSKRKNKKKKHKHDKGEKEKTSEETTDKHQKHGKSLLEDKEESNTVYSENEFVDNLVQNTDGEENYDGSGNEDQGEHFDNVQVENVRWEIFYWKQWKKTL